MFLLPFKKSEKTKVLSKTDYNDFGVFKINAAKDTPTYVKVYKYNREKNTISKKPIATLFIRGGKSLTLYVPKGEFIIKYATGKTWYGEEEMFGSSGSYAKADKIFKISTQDEGYEITLAQVKDGNLSSVKQNKDKF